MQGVWGTTANAEVGVCCVLASDDGGGIGEDAAGEVSVIQKSRRLARMVSTVRGRRDSKESRYSD